METKDKIIEILERCLEDKGKLPEFYADQILAEFKKEVMDLSTFKTKAEKEILDEIKNNPNWKGSLLKSWQEKLKSG